MLRVSGIGNLRVKDRTNNTTSTKRRIATTRAATFRMTIAVMVVFATSDSMGISMPRENPARGKPLVFRPGMFWSVLTISATNPDSFLQITQGDRTYKISNQP